MLRYLIVVTSVLLAACSPGQSAQLRRQGILLRLRLSRHRSNFSIRYLPLYLLCRVTTGRASLSQPEAP